MLPQRNLLAALLFASLFATGCFMDASREKSNLPLLHDRLAREFGDQLNVHFAMGVNRGTISVTFINSALNDATDAERAKRAEETAQIVKTHFTQPNSFAALVVVFIRQTARFGVFHESKTVASYPFDKDAKPALLLPVDQPFDSEITVGYSATEGVTDVSSASTLQLDGEPGGYGLTVMPHFKVPGDARRRKAPPPEEVLFYFASYSKKPRFSETVRVEFIADSTPLLEAKATFTGHDAQYCSLKVSYSVFRKLISAEEASMKLGAKEYPLTPQQIALLRKMDAYVLE